MKKLQMGVIKATIEVRYCYEFFTCFLNGFQKHATFLKQFTSIRDKLISDN